MMEYMEHQARHLVELVLQMSSTILPILTTTATNANSNSSGFVILRVRRRSDWSSSDVQRSQHRHKLSGTKPTLYLYNEEEPLASMASLCVCARHFSVATKMRKRILGYARHILRKMSKHFLIFSFLTKKDLEDIEKAIPFMKSKEQELAVKLNETLDVLLKAFDLSHNHEQR